jgi:hypothetical protein
VSRHVPILTEVVTRAWGLDDPRVVSLLRAENQPGPHRRTAAVGERAKDAGWPPATYTVKAANEAQIRALRRMERMDFLPRSLDRRRLGFRAAAAAQRRQQVDVYLTDDDLASIFDE